MGQWTAEQQEAIETTKPNVLISAAAGSGKTAVLIERLMRIVLQDRVDIDRVLVVTFTKAAAAEMKARAAARLMKHVEDNPGDGVYVRRQVALLNQAYFMTFHAFCREVIRNHYYLIGMEPEFRVAEQSEIQAIQKEALEEVLEAQYRDMDLTFLQLVDMYCRYRDDQELQELILTLHRFSRSHPNPDQWLMEQSDAFGWDIEPFVHSEWVGHLLKGIAYRLEHAQYCLEEALHLSEQPDGPIQYQTLLTKEWTDLSELLRKARDHDLEVLERVRNFSFGRLPSKPSENEEMKDQAKKYRDEAKNEIKHMQHQWLFRTLTENHQDHCRMAPFMEKLTNLVFVFDQSYRQKKDRARILDFSDLEHRALEILNNAEAQGNYRQLFESIFIDEYQDSNRVQETLISRISGKNAVYRVGDVKQSIYRFRLAEPELFMEKNRQFQEDSDPGNHLINLNKNFRSSREIIAAVNEVFENLMSEELGEITYDQKARLVQGNPGASGDCVPVEVHLMDSSGGQEKIEGNDDQAAEAQIIADRIRRLLKQEMYDEELCAYRRITYRDIVILHRAPGTHAQMLQDVFSKEGLPVYMDLGSGFFESQEVKWVINLLRLVDHEPQDHALVSVLLSPFGKLTTGELASIRLNHPGIPFHESFLKMEQEQGSIAWKIKHFREKLGKWRRLQRKIPFHEFMWHILQESDFFAVCGAMPGGAQRQANLRMLVEKAVSFQEGTRQGLFSFLCHVDQLHEGKNKDGGPARTLEEHDDVVRVMSIHQSKGLEFPVVILAGLGKRFNQTESQTALMVHRLLGMGPVYADPELRIQRDTMTRIAIREKSSVESLSEEMRILYVGMTRAQQKLLMIGTTNSMEQKQKKWNRPLETGHLVRAMNFLDWLGPVWMRHQSFRDPSLTQETDSCWEFFFWNPGVLQGEKERKQEQDRAFQQALDSGVPLDEGATPHWIQQQLEWFYPHEEETEIKSKVSVTELTENATSTRMKPHQLNTSTLKRQPTFMRPENKSITPEEKGSLLHYILQQLDLNLVSDQRVIDQQLESMKQRDMISSEEVLAIDSSLIHQFFSTPLGKRLIQSSCRYRELPFVIRETRCPSVLVQGIIDCCFLEKNQWILVDYKTEWVNPKNLDAWTETHRAQLNLYQQALEQITGIPVGECHLYSFYLGQAVLLSST